MPADEIGEAAKAAVVSAVGVQAVAQGKGLDGVAAAAEEAVLTAWLTRRVAQAAQARRRRRAPLGARGPPSFPRCEVLDLRGSIPRAVAVITQQPAPLFVVFVVVVVS